MKKFKAKKKRKPFFMYTIIIIVSFLLTLNILFKLDLKSSNEEFITFMLNDINYTDKYNSGFLKKIFKNVFNIDFSPKEILENTLYYQEKEKSIVTQYIKDPNKENKNNPKVYIYNTHQLENYDLNNYSEYNITPNVLMASYLLEGLLNKDGINTIVEESNINDFLSLNGWNYSYSYKASRYFVEDTINKNPSLELIIDLHRDSIAKEKSTVTVGGKNYAKLLFIIGTDYKNEENLNLANALNNIIKEKYPDLTRGIKKQGGEGYNGVYNQDLSNKMILIECGGNENSIDEVMNTIIVLKDAIKQYLGDING